MPGCGPRHKKIRRFRRNETDRAWKAVRRIFIWQALDEPSSACFQFHELETQAVAGYLMIQDPVPHAGKSVPKARTVQMSVHDLPDTPLFQKRRDLRGLLPFAKRRVMQHGHQVALGHLAARVGQRYLQTNQLAPVNPRVLIRVLRGLPRQIITSPKRHASFCSATMPLGNAARTLAREFHQ